MAHLRRDEESLHSGAFANAEAVLFANAEAVLSVGRVSIGAAILPE